MNLWWDVVSTIAKNLGALVFSGVARLCRAPQVRGTFQAIAVIWSFPYRIFRRLNPEGRISIVKYAPSNAHWLAALIEMIFLPYTAYLESTKTMGESGHDSAALGLWFGVALIALVALLFLLVWLAEDFVFD